MVRPMMSTSIRFVSSLFLALSLAGCGGADIDEPTSSSTEDSASDVSKEALHGSKLGEKLVGGWKAQGSLYPRLDLAADGTYSLDTGMRCATNVCASGESGVWNLYRSMSGRYYVGLFTKTSEAWYQVRTVEGEPKLLTGAFGTKGAFEPLPRPVYCVEWEAADENGNSLGAFYAENVKSYQEGKDKLAQITWFTHEAISEGTCAAQAPYCTEQYAPVCGEVFSEGVSTFGNLCELKVAVRTRAGDTATAKGRWTPGACEETPSGPFCGGIAAFACPGVGTCVDDPNDGCDPAAGGADCGGICQCDAVAKCGVGMYWDASPEVCSCVLENPCMLAKCSAGYVCENHDGSAVCVSDGTAACGNTVCGAGSVCCNASCGICTAPGMACIQIACELARVLVPTSRRAAERSAALLVCARAPNEPGSSAVPRQHCGPIRRHRGMLEA
jgi:hypothetical protein